MERARRHQVALGRGAFVLLALVAELAGRSLTHRLDVGQHVGAPSYARTDYYPFLLAIVKGGVALMLALIAWRIVRAHAAERAARRLIVRLGAAPNARAPRMRIELSARLCAAIFGATSLLFLVQTDLERISTGRWPLLAPWLHSSALPVFAVLSVLASVVYRGCARWLVDYERYSRETVAFAYRLAAHVREPAPAYTTTDSPPPRHLHGVVLSSRPPPVPA
jgi:hypothetical protein